MLWGRLELLPLVALIRPLANKSLNNDQSDNPDQMIAADATNYKFGFRVINSVSMKLFQLLAYVCCDYLTKNEFT